MYCLIFSIVSESGASIYSASDIAKKELPDLDVTLRGAGMILNISMMISNKSHSSGCC